MCESHVSNPQTVGKCCSLLNSLLPPSVALSLVRLDRSPGAQPGLPQPHASVGVCAGECARVCLPFSTPEVSAERLPARLRLEPPLPADSFYANTESFTTHTHTYSHRQPLRLPVKNNKVLLLVSFSPCVYLCIPSASSSSTQTLTFSQFVYFVFRSRAATPHSLSLTTASKTVVSHSRSVNLKRRRSPPPHTHTHTGKEDA